MQVALANLDFAMYTVFNYICRHCLEILKKRQNLKQNLKQLEESMRKVYAVSAVKAGFAFKPKELQLSSDFALKRPRLEGHLNVRVRLFGRIQKRICDLRSYGVFTTKKTEDPKKDHLP